MRPGRRRTGRVAPGAASSSSPWPVRPSSDRIVSVLSVFVYCVWMRLMVRLLRRLPGSAGRPSLLKRPLRARQSAGRARRCPLLPLVRPVPRPPPLRGVCLVTSHAVPRPPQAAGPRVLPSLRSAALIVPTLRHPLFSEPPGDQPTTRRRQTRGGAAFYVRLNLTFTGLYLFCLFVNCSPLALTSRPGAVGRPRGRDRSRPRRGGWRAGRRRRRAGRRR